LESPKFDESLAQFPPNLKPYITFLYFCGGRSGEAELIEGSQVDLEGKVIRMEDDPTTDKEGMGNSLASAIGIDAGKNRTETGPRIRYNQHPQGMEKGVCCCRSGPYHRRGRQCRTTLGVRD
jgi:hypothetical protein